MKGYISLCVFQGGINEAELVVMIEYPKTDVHEWRKKRDIDLYGQLLQSLMDHVTAQVNQLRTPPVKKVLSFRLPSFVLRKDNTISMRML